MLSRFSPQENPSAPILAARVGNYLERPMPPAVFELDIELQILESVPTREKYDTI